MTEKNEKLEAGLASDLNRELDTLPQYKPTDYDPFDGDFGDCGDTIFNDKMVKGRKEYICVHCKGEIKKGEIYRNLNAKFDGQLMSYRWCAGCCDAMVKELEIRDNEFEGEEFPFETRLDLFEPSV